MMKQILYEYTIYLNYLYLEFVSMTKTKTILAISLATVFAVSMIAFVPLADAFGHPSYLDIKKTDVKTKNKIAKGTHTLDVKIDTTGKIPKDGSVGLFGYGVLTDGLNNVLALTSHGGAFDHTHQDDASDPVFHAHILDLAAPGTIGDTCVGLGDAVVDFASSISSVNNIDAQYKVKVNGKHIDVKKVPVSDLGDAGVEAIVAFNIVPGPGPLDPSAPVPLPFLCIDIAGTGVGI